jgi:hypothetical protein
MTHSMVEAESDNKYRDVHQKMPPSYSIKIAGQHQKSGLNDAAKYGSAESKRVNKNKSANSNIYYQAHQINLLKSIREHKE